MLLAFVLVLGMGVSAQAANPSLIEEGKTGSITIHKFDNTGSGTGVGDTANGTIIEDTQDLGNPIPGITFTVTLLPEATSTTTVTEAKAMVEAMETAGTLATNQTSGTTNASGIYKFDNLAQGIYLVQEVSSSSVTGTVESFLVSIPMTNPVNQSEWLYDIHVYPKNTEINPSVTKEIRSAGDDVMSQKADVGDTIDCVITPSIPAAIASIDLTGGTGYYYITDTLDTRLDYVSATVQLVDSEGNVKATLAAGTHYTLTAPTAGGGGEIKVDFNLQTGLDTLLEAKANGYELEIIVTTRINETAVNNLGAAISNSASFYFSPDNDPEDPENPPTPITPPTNPQIELTGLALYKYWMDGSTKTSLNDAVFTIYASSDDVGDNSSMELVSGTPWTKTTGVTEIVTGGIAKDGYIYFSQADIMTALGLDPTNAADIEAFESEYSAFYLVETTAPAGFDLLEQAVVISLGTTAEVENVKNPNFTLPITGGSGTLLFTIIGILLIGGAVTLLFVSRKKKGEKSK